MSMNKNESGERREGSALTPAEVRRKNQERQNAHYLGSAHQVLCDPDASSFLNQNSGRLKARRRLHQERVLRQAFAPVRKYLRELLHE
jgi:hypothetical protein